MGKPIPQTSRDDSSYIKNLFANDKSIKRNEIIFASSVVGITLIAIAVITALYLTNTLGTQAAFNHAFTQHLTVGQGLLYIGVPVVGAGLLIRLAVHIYQTHKRNMSIGDIVGLDGTANIRNKTFRDLKPSRRQVIAAAVVLLALSGLAVGGYFLVTKVALVGNMVTPAFQHKLQIWQSLAYIGGGAVLATTTTFLALHIIQKIAQKRREAAQNRIPEVSQSPTPVKKKKIKMDPDALVKELSGVV